MLKLKKKKKKKTTIKYRNIEMKILDFTNKTQ